MKSKVDCKRKILNKRKPRKRNCMGCNNKRLSKSRYANR